MSKMLVDVEVIRKLADILTETGLTEIEVSEKAVSSNENKQEEDLSKNPGAVLSPMIGVAYLTPEPSASPFVKIGDEVKSGQIIMLIEAMKTFNQIRAPKAGKLTRILVSSGEPVEYGEVLAVIE